MKKIITSVLVLILIALSVMTVYLYNGQRKIVYMDNYTVFNSFDFKKEMDTTMFLIEEEIRVQIDSIITLLNTTEKALELNSTTELQLRYNAISKNLEEAHQEAETILQQESSKMTQEVYVKLNEYIKLYSEMNHLDIVLGAAGNGTFMYLNDELNCTDDLILFINKKYSEE
jgi:outer membrane protein